LFQGKYLSELQAQKCPQNENAEEEHVSEPHTPLATSALIGLGNAKLFSAAENKHCGTE
jgi:hypothetical protein